MNLTELNHKASKLFKRIKHKADLLDTYEKLLTSQFNVNRFFGQSIYDTEWCSWEDPIRKITVSFRTNFKYLDYVVTVEYDYIEDYFVVRNRSEDDYYSRLF